MHPIPVIIAILPFSSSLSIKGAPPKTFFSTSSFPRTLHRYTKRTGWNTPCGLPGYEEYPSGAFESHSFQGAGDLVSNCLDLCQKTSECESFGVGGSSCFLYSSGISGNVQADPNSPFVFYEKTCSDEDASSSSSSSADSTSSGHSTMNSDATERIYSDQSSDKEPTASSYRGHSTDSEPDGFETDFDLVEDFTGLVGEEFEPLPHSNADEDEDEEAEDDIDEDIDADGFNPEEDPAGADGAESGSGSKQVVVDWFGTVPRKTQTTTSIKSSPTSNSGTVRMGHDFRI